MKWCVSIHADGQTHNRWGLQALGVKILDFFLPFRAVVCRGTQAHVQAPYCCMLHANLWNCDSTQTHYNILVFWAVPNFRYPKTNQDRGESAAFTDFNCEKLSLHRAGRVWHQQERLLRQAQGRGRMNFLNRHFWKCMGLLEGVSTWGRTFLSTFILYLAVPTGPFLGPGLFTNKHSALRKIWVCRP